MFITLLSITGCSVGRDLRQKIAHIPFDFCLHRSVDGHASMDGANSFERIQSRDLSADIEAVENGSGCSRCDQDRGHVGLTLNLAFLNPDITRAIVRASNHPACV